MSLPFAWAETFITKTKNDANRSFQSMFEFCFSDLRFSVLFCFWFVFVFVSSGRACLVFFSRFINDSREVVIRRGSQQRGGRRSIFFRHFRQTLERRFQAILDVLLDALDDASLMQISFGRLLLLKSLADAFPSLSLYLPNARWNLPE